MVFDNELAPAQQFNLEKVLGRTAIDRTAVILDIFGQNAHTLEGKAQVELALLRYRLPRLRRGKAANLSQQRGGVGARFGGGETKIEVDRRRIMRRITKLEGDLTSLADTRDLQRKSRRRSGLASVAIVGYTNAGKSTLLNRLTDAGVLTEDRLFATLDPTTRRLALPGGEPVLLSDTVGFVRNLPHGLVEAFKGTLEVAALADYLVHVVDASAPDPRGPDRSGARGAVGDRRGRGPRAARVQQGRPRPRRRRRPRRRPSGIGRGRARRPAQGIELFLRTLADRLRALTAVVRAADPVRPWRRAGVGPPRGRSRVDHARPTTASAVRARLSEASAGRLGGVRRALGVTAAR